MIGDFFINNIDAKQAYGISLHSSALTTLMTPVAVKEYITNEVRTENGTRLINAEPRVASRTFTLMLNLTAKNERQFLERYAAFCEVLQAGELRLRTKWQPEVTYVCYYKNCSQYSQFLNGIANLSLTLIEPDPSNR